MDKFTPANFNPNFVGYTGQGEFRYWCQTVLPLVYDDSLSYYELLNKVVNYLNNVITDVSAMENNIESTKDSFIELQQYVNDNFDTLVETYNTLQGYVDDYFTNLDVQDEINTKLNSMAADGSLSALIAPLAPSVITDWLNENITPTTPIVDETLTISGAAADAKVTGDNITDLKNVLEEYNAFDYIGEYGSFVNNTDHGIVLTWDGHTANATGSSTSTFFQNIIVSTSSLPSYLEAGRTYYASYDSTDTNLYIKMFLYSNGSIIANLDINKSQFVTIPSGCTGIIIRVQVESGKTLTNAKMTFGLLSYTSNRDIIKSVPYNYGVPATTISSCDNVKYNSIIFVGTSGGVPNIPDFPISDAGWLETIAVGEIEGYVGTVQIAWPYDPSQKSIMYRVYHSSNSSWMDWRYIIQDANLSLPINPVSLHELMVKSIIQYGMPDLSLYMNRVNTGSNVRFEWDTDRTCHIYGSDISNNWTTLFTSPSTLPVGVEPGNLYQVKFNGVNCKLQIYPYVNNTLGSALLDTFSDESIWIPANVSGLIIRIWAPKDTTIDETVDFKMYLDASNSSISKALDFVLPNFMYYIRGANEITSTISCVWNGDELHISGTTSTSKFWHNIYSNSTVMPGGIQAGHTYGLIFNGENVTAKIFGYDSNGGISSFLTTKKSSYFYVPSDIVGMIIRVDVEANTTVDEIVKLGFVQIKPNLTYGSTFVNYGYAYHAYNTDCNDITEDGVFFVSSYNENSSLSNFAFNRAGWLFTTSYQENRFQVALPYSGEDTPSYRSRDLNGNWTRWVPLSSGETVYQYTTIETGTYNNTYTITTTPTITTDTNGWLQPVDTESSTDTNKTDMTGPILSMLTSTGYCHLAPGIFYVSGSIDMPAGSTLEGCGDKTVVRLLSSVSNGYIIKPSSNCTIKNLRLSGSYSEIDISSSNIGGRNGIYCTGSANQHNMIEQCFFDGFSGSGILQYNNGGSTNGYVYMQQCFISNCGAGINIDYKSEYCKYIDVIINKCYYACINNGGNNVFVGCTFHGTIGFLIDNSNNDKDNHAHGSVVGCTFNHIDSWNHPDTLGGGDAIKIINVANGFIFTGCQIWYGAINIQNSKGIAISDTLIGGNTPSIAVTGSYPAFFSGCIFHQTPSITDTASSKFTNCFLDSTGAVIQ